jgi:hypothetical protein
VGLALKGDATDRAHRELLLIDACQSYGVGNWADIAEHIGSYRTKEQVEAHYLQTYLNPETFPQPASLLLCVVMRLTSGCSTGEAT